MMGPPTDEQLAGESKKNGRGGGWEIGRIEATPLPFSLSPTLPLYLPSTLLLAPNPPASHESGGRNPSAFAHTPSAKLPRPTDAATAPRGPARSAPNRRTPRARPSRLRLSMLHGKDQTYRPYSEIEGSKTLTEKRAARFIPAGFVRRYQNGSSRN